MSDCEQTGPSSAGYMRHKRDGTEPCEACKESRRQYVQQHYADNPDKVTENRQYARARSRALYALARRHRGEFAALLQEYSE